MITIVNRNFLPNLFCSVVGAAKRFHELISFEKRLSRKSKIVLFLLAALFWLASPGTVKFALVSNHCLNLGIGLILHAFFLYKKGKPCGAFKLNLGRPGTMLLGAAFFLGGVAIRTVLH